MRGFTSLWWILLVMGSTVLAAAGPGLLPRKSEKKRQPTPAPQPFIASPPAEPKPAAAKPAASKPPAAKPKVAKSEPRRTAATARAPERSAASTSTSSTAAASPGREGTASREPSTTRRVLREWDLWLGAVQAQQAEYSGRLVIGAEEVERIEEDPSLSALTSQRNRKEAAIPAAEALRAHRQREWQRHLDGRAGRPAPLQVEQLMKQGESIAFRTSTATADTQGLIARIRRTPGVAAGGHLGVEAMAPDLMIAHLRTVPGGMSGGLTRPTYEVQKLDALRARMEQGRADLAEQFKVVRQDWIASSARAAELHRKYLQLRTALVAPDE